MHTAERVCKVLTSRLVRDPIRHSNLRSTRPAVAWPCIYLVEQAALTATKDGQKCCGPTLRDMSSK